jgi:outer membrane protein OmpA-like peptidoglycan-associated protein
VNLLKIGHIIGLLLVIEHVAAQNLVPNGGFEEYIGKGHSRYWTQAQEEFNHFYHSDLKSPNGGAANGNGYHCLCMYGMQENEFMHVALGKRLEPNKRYLLTMNVRISNAGDEVHKYDLPKKLKRLDWYFTSIPLNVLNKLFITAEPSASFGFVAPHATVWTPMSLEYDAVGDEQFLTIGNITRIFEKIKEDEKKDSVQAIFTALELREKHEMDSVRNKFIVELDEYKVSSTDEFSMNPYVENKRKKRRREQKKYDEQLRKNNEVGQKIKDGQVAVKRKYHTIIQKYEAMVDNDKLNFSINVCFDDISITEMKGVSVANTNPISTLKPVEGKTIVLKNIRFNTDEAVLLEGSTNQLDELIQWMKTYPETQIQISGHTDNTGTEKHNLELSANRAKAVVEYLNKNGIETERMKFKGYAARYALADNSSEAGRSLNRRVEVTILKTE